MIWLVVVGLVVLAGLTLYWLLITTEGAYLGARAVALLYNRVAERYDSIKGFDPRYEEAFLTRPLLLTLRNRQEPLVLDVATGTGRLPVLLLESGAFDGRVVGLDLARDMLAVAARKTTGHQDRVVFVWQNAMQLPFPDQSFDLVTCLEALEFMPRPRQVLAEIARVARPGGLVITTRRRGWGANLMPGKSWSPEGYQTLLGSLGLQKVKAVSWQLDYDLVWARKSVGGSVAVGRGNGRWKEELICCPQCGARPLAKERCLLCCATCARCYSIAADGVLELAAAKPLPSTARNHSPTVPAGQASGGRTFVDSP